MNKKQLLEKVKEIVDGKVKKRSVDHNPTGPAIANDLTDPRKRSPGMDYLRRKAKKKPELVEGFPKLTPAARAALVQATKTGPMEKRREAKEKLATVMQQAKQIQKVKAKAKETWAKKAAAGPEVTPEPPAPKPEPKVAPKPKQSKEDRMALLKKVAQKRLMDVRTFNPKSKSNRDY